MRVFQWILFIALVAVSSLLALNLALGLGSTPLEKGLLAACCLAIEGVKTYTLLSANRAAGGRAWRRALGLYAAYAFAALCSLSSCLGYALAATERMGAAAAVLDHDSAVAAERAAMADCDQQVAALRALISQRQAALSHLEQPAQIAQSRRAIGDGLTRIDSYLTRRSDAAARIETWRAQDHASRAAARPSPYDAIGEVIHVPARRVAFALWVLIALAIELGILVTSPHGAAAASPEPRAMKARRPLPAFVTALLGALGIGAALPKPAQARVRERQPCRSPSEPALAKGR